MMLSVTDFVSDDLCPTKTYARRSFVFIPAVPEYTARTGLLGNLITKVQHSKSGVRRAVEVDSYGVEKDTPEPGDEGGTAYWLVNHTDKTQEEPYRCVVGGMKPKCRCKAGKCRVPEPCKHLASLTHLTEQGII